ncbi:MAG: hypothetical protein ABIM98_07420 [candidate division WOR-3 bacterium]
MEWFKINTAIRAEYRLLSLSMSTYLEIIYNNKIFIFDGLNKLKPNRKLYAIKENEVPTPTDLVIFRNTRYILAISNKLYKAKDCDVAILPSETLSDLQKRLSELPDMQLPKFLFKEFDKENFLYFYVPKNLYYKKKDIDVLMRNKIVPRVITDCSEFYDNSYPLPYIRKANIAGNIFFVNVDFEYVIYEKALHDYRVYFLPAEVSFSEFNFIPDEVSGKDKEVNNETSPFHLQATFNFEKQTVRLSIPELHKVEQKVA